MRLTYSVDVSNATARLEKIGAAFDDMTQGPMAAGFARAGTVYLASMRRRFVDAARGDGTWPDLVESTKLARQRGKKLGGLKSDLSKARFLTVTLAIRREIDEERNRLRLDSLRRKLGRSKSLSQEQAARRNIASHIKRSTGRSGNKRSQKITSLSLGNFEILRDTGLLLNSLTQGTPGNISNPLVDGIVVGTAIKYAKHHQFPKVEGRPPTRKILVPPDDPTRNTISGVLKSAVAETLEQIRNA